MKWLLVSILIAAMTLLPGDTLDIDFVDPKTQDIVYTEGFPLLDKGELLIWLEEDKTDENEYQYPDYVCTDFATDLIDSFYEDFGFHGIYYVHSRRGMGRHALVVALIGNPYEPEGWLVIEPQTDEYKTIDRFPSPYYPMEATFWYENSGREYPFIRMYMCERKAQPYFVTSQIICSSFDPWVYDLDGNGVISKPEIIVTINDYFAGKITKEQMLQVLEVYFG